MSRIGKTARFLALSAVTLGACTASPHHEPQGPRVLAPADTLGTPHQSLLSAIRDSLRGIKPEAKSVQLVSLLPGRNAGDRAYLVIADVRGPGTGTTPLTKSGQIFALFWVDSLLQTPTRLLDTFPTGRGGDWDVWLLRSWSGHIVICAEGASYGDAPMQRSITLDSDAVTAKHITVVTERTPQTWNDHGGCSTNGPKSAD